MKKGINCKHSFSGMSYQVDRILMSKRDDEERFRNMLMSGTPATDEEMTSFMPWLAGIVVVGLIVWGLVVLFS